MGKEIWLSMHVRNSGSDKIVRKFVRLPFHVSGCGMAHLLARGPKAFKYSTGIHVMVN